MNMFLSLYTWITTRRGEEGATAVEYGLLVALIAAVIIGTVVILGTEINSAFLKITNVLPV